MNPKVGLKPMQLDVVIFGGGAAGLCLLDELVRHGFRVLLLETAQLGSGQTVAAQGIIHGGLKYTLQGLLTPSAVHIREMPQFWRACLSGSQKPDLRGTRIRSEFCYLWRTKSLTSRLGMMGAMFGLQVTPKTLSVHERPGVLSNCSGTVARLDEQVIAPDSFVQVLAVEHRERLLQIDCNREVDFAVSGPGKITAIRLKRPGSSQSLKLRPKQVVFTAGVGNAELRKRVGLDPNEMQRRPLHMVMLRGPLPHFNGHCVDGAKTRVTITPDTDSAGRTVWQLGGQIAEDGVGLDEATLIEKTRDELNVIFPALNLSNVEVATYRIDRAERKTPNNKRPDNVQLICEGNCITAWPTKLALAPQLAKQVADRLGLLSSMGKLDLSMLSNWPRPTVAKPPWETQRKWYALQSGTPHTAFSNKAA